MSAPKSIYDADHLRIAAAVIELRNRKSQDSAIPVKGLVCFSGDQQITTEAWMEIRRRGTAEKIMFCHRPGGRTNKTTLGNYTTPAAAHEAWREVAIASAAGMTTSHLSSTGRKATRKAVAVNTFDYWHAQWIDAVKAAHADGRKRVAERKIPGKHLLMTIECNYKRWVKPIIGQQPLTEINSDWLIGELRRMRDLPEYAIDTDYAVGDPKRIVGNAQFDTMTRVLSQVRAVLGYVQYLAPKGLSGVDFKAGDDKRLALTLEKPKTRHNTDLNRHQLRAFWALLDDERQTDRAIKMVLLTGCRRGEICGDKAMKWADFDSSAWTAGLRDTKNGNDHTIYLTAEMMDIMQQQIDVPEMPGLAGRVFQFTNSDALYSRVVELREQLQKADPQFPPIAPHGLRKTFGKMCSQDALLELPRGVVDACLNHVQGGVGAVHYDVKVSPAQMAACWKKWSDFIRTYLIEETPFPEAEAIQSIASAVPNDFKAKLLARQMAIKKSVA